MSHPHDLEAGVPIKLPPDIVRDLSKLKPGKALFDLAIEWLGIIFAIGIYLWAQNPIVYILAVIFIGARQHALTVLGHDAAHYRFLSNRRLNDWIANIFMQWPVFITVAGFRKFHGTHHRYLNDEKDGNRFLWRTHNKKGELKPEWYYPKKPKALILKLLRRGIFLTGIRWIIRGIIGAFIVRDSLALMIGRLLYFAAFAFLFTHYQLWTHFLLIWIIPLCTWHVVIQYMRLIAEHSAVRSTHPDLAETRTTIPRWWEAVLILPRNIGYHIEHHWYPSVPYYNLPQLHAHLMRIPEFANAANISKSIIASMVEVSKAKTDDSITRIVN